MNHGPLQGVTIIELAGLGALPFATLKLADMGADIIRIDRTSEVPDEPEAKAQSSWDRGRRSIGVDLKQPDGVETVLRLVEGAEALVEAFRPGVAERLGLGPEQTMARNPALVYGRLTGWGQDGPLAPTAGHSLNYEAVTGVIGAMGRPESVPAPLLTLLGDFAGGGLHLAYGLVCALFDARSSGQGQVVDAAMTEGVISLASVFYVMQSSGMHSTERGTNLFDGGAPFYNVYECADGGYISVGPIEPHFYALLLEGLDLEDEDLGDQYDQEAWPRIRARLAERFASRTRDQWCETFEGSDACVAPVLTFDEARDHPQNRSRETFTGPAGTDVRPVPRLSRTPGDPGPSPAWTGADTDAVLADAGFDADEVAELRARGAIA